MRLGFLGARQAGVFILPMVLISVLALFSETSWAEEPAPGGAEPIVPLGAALGVHFVEGSTSTVMLERDGRQYLVDLETRTVQEYPAPIRLASVDAVPAQAALPAGTANSGAAIFREQCASCHGQDGRGLSSAGTPNFTDFRARSGVPRQRIVDVITNGRSGTAMQGFAGKLSSTDIADVASYVQSLAAQGERKDLYEPADDFVYSLPTGRAVPSKGLYINFSHRFPYNPAFHGAGLGNTLLGLDGFSISSLGLRYGVTSKLSVSIYRAPSVIGRPIEFAAGYRLLDEYDDQPFNASVRVSVDGQDHFRRNFTTNFEGIVSRSISNRAQFYAVPTFSLQNRILLGKNGPIESRPDGVPGINSFSLGAGLAVNVRPTVALVAEAIPTLFHGTELGIHRPAYGFGIQKRISGHAFTLGFSTGPGTVVAQRAGTRATYIGDPTADKPSGLFIGFNLMRRLH